MKYFIAAFFINTLLCYSQKSPCPQPTDNMFLSLYKEKAKKKVDDLGYMLTIIADKSTDPLDANTAIDKAVELFISEDAKVQVSNARNTSYTNSFKIREYLKRLKVLKYDKVEIEWTSIQYVSDLRLGEDSNYYGVISYEQMFRGIRDGRIIYGDIVKKNTQVILKRQQIKIDGENFDCWDVFLSDIEVTQSQVK